MKRVTLEQVKAELELLELLVDGYHRKVKTGIKPMPYTKTKLMERTMLVGYNLSEVDKGIHVTMKDPLFQRLMVIAKIIDGFEK